MISLPSQVRITLEVIGYTYRESCCAIVIVASLFSGVKSERKEFAIREAKLLLNSGPILEGMCPQ